MLTDDYTEADLAKIELDFIRHLVDLGGWRSDKPEMLYDPERDVRGRWIADGRLQRAKRDGRAVIELTDAGYDWCRRNGVSS